MFGRHGLAKVLVGLIVIALIVGALSSGQRNAWTQGYLMGRAGAGLESGAGVPGWPYGYPQYGGLSFGGLGPLLILALLALLFIGASRAFRRGAWAAHGGHGPDKQTWQEWAQAHAEHFGHHWRPGGPWCCERDSKAGEDTVKSETDQVTPADAG